MSVVSARPNTSCKPDSYAIKMGCPDDTMLAVFSDVETGGYVQLYGDKGGRWHCNPSFFDAHFYSLNLSVVELYLCETERVVLKPYQLYRFVVDSNCDACKRLAKDGAP